MHQHQLNMIRLWHRFVHHLHEIVVAVTVEMGRMHTVEIFLMVAGIFFALAVQVYFTAEVE